MIHLQVVQSPVQDVHKMEAPRNICRTDWTSDDVLASGRPCTDDGGHIVLLVIDDLAKCGRCEEKRKEGNEYHNGQGQGERGLLARQGGGQGQRGVFVVVYSH